LPWYTTYGVAPSSIFTTICTGTIAPAPMLIYAALAILFAILTIGIPHTVSSLVGGSIGLVLAHAFEAAYIACTVISSVTAGLRSISSGVSSLAGNKGSDDRREQSALQGILDRHQRQSSSER